MEADLAEAERAKGPAGRLTYEIFSILESKFLFGGGHELVPRAPAPAARADKVCVLSIDGGARPVDGLLAGAALVRLETALQRRAGSKAARLADFFDVAAGSGVGGVLAAMLFARGPHGRPLYSAEDALGFLLRRVRRRGGGWSGRGAAGALVRRNRAAASAFRNVFGNELTLRDTVRPVLVPCYDLATRAAFLFSCADAAESPAYDFRLRDVCAATCAGAAGGAAVEVVSVDGGTRIAAVGSDVALGNPTAAAITHVLNNRREFPAAAGVGDLLVMSIGTGEADRSRRPEIARIAAQGVSDTVDQAVAMAFGHSRTSNYVRIQGTGTRRGGGGRRAAPLACGGEAEQLAEWEAEEMLRQRSVESVLFQGRKLAGETNAEKLERFARELAKEQQRRKQHAAAAAAAALVSSAARRQPSTATAQNATTASSATAVATVTTTTAEAAPPRRRRTTSQNATTASYSTAAATVTVTPTTEAAPPRRRRTPARAAASRSSSSSSSNKNLVGVR